MTCTKSVCYSFQEKLKKTSQHKLISLFTACQYPKLETHENGYNVIKTSLLPGFLSFSYNCARPKSSYAFGIVLYLTVQNH